MSSRTGKGHLKRVQELACRRGDSAQVRAFAAEAALWLAQAQANAPETGKSKSKGPSSESGSTNERGKDAKSQMILAKLDEPVSMSFNEERRSKMSSSTSKRRPRRRSTRVSRSTSIRSDCKRRRSR